MVVLVIMAGSSGRSTNAVANADCWNRGNSSDSYGFKDRLRLRLLGLMRLSDAARLCRAGADDGVQMGSGRIS